MKLLLGKCQKVQNPEARGGSPGAQGATQAGTAEIVNSSGTTPEKLVIGAGGNEAGATPPQDLVGRTDVPMDEAALGSLRSVLRWSLWPDPRSGPPLRKILEAWWALPNWLERVHCLGLQYSRVRNGGTPDSVAMEEGLRCLQVVLQDRVRTVHTHEWRGEAWPTN